MSFYPCRVGGGNLKVTEYNYIWDTIGSSDFSPSKSYSVPSCVTLIIFVSDNRVAITPNFQFETQVKLKSTNAIAYLGVKKGTVNLKNTGGGGCQSYGLSFS